MLNSEIAVLERYNCADAVMYAAVALFSVAVKREAGLDCEAV